MNGFPGLQTSDLDVYKRGQRSKPSKKHSSLLQRIGPKVSTNGLVTDGGGDGSRMVGGCLSSSERLNVLEDH